MASQGGNGASRSPDPSLSSAAETCSSLPRRPPEHPGRSSHGVHSASTRQAPSRPRLVPSDLSSSGSPLVSHWAAPGDLLSPNRPTHQGLCLCQRLHCALHRAPCLPSPVPEAQIQGLHAPAATERAGQHDSPTVSAGIAPTGKRLITHRASFVPALCTLLLCTNKSKLTSHPVVTFESAMFPSNVS